MDIKNVLEGIGVLVVRQFVLLEKPFRGVTDYNARIHVATELGRQMYDLIIRVKDRMGPIEATPEKSNPQERLGLLKNWHHLHIMSNILPYESSSKKDPLPEWAKKSMEKLL